MISAQDRVPLYPGRVLLAPVTGSPNTYDMSRADQPTQEGTPLNADTLAKLQGDVRELTIKDGESISAGDAVNVDGGVYKDVTPQDNVENTIITSRANDTAVCVLSETDSIFAQCTSANYAVYLRKIDTKTGNYSGSTLTIGTGNGSKNAKLSKLDGDRCIIQYIDGSYLRANVVNSGNSLTNGTGKDIATSVTNTADLVALTQSSFVSFYNENGMKCVVSTVSGNVITLGSTEYSLSGNTGANYISACRLPDEGGNKRVCICFSDTGDGNKGKAVIATVDSSNVVTFGDVVTVTDTTTSGTACASDSNCIVATFSLETTVLNFDLSVKIPGSALSVTKIVTVKDGLFVGYYSGGTDVARVLLVSDTISSGDLYYYNSNSNVSYVSGTAVSDNKILLAYADAGNSSFGTTTILTVEGNQIAGSFIDASRDAIALADGTGGQSIPVGFGGYCECPGVTEGQQITSDGVSAFSPIDGWLAITDARDIQYVIGEYMGDGTYGVNNPTVIDLGFKAKFIAVNLISDNEPTQPYFLYAVMDAVCVYNGGGTNSLTVIFNETSISFYSRSNSDGQFKQLNGLGYVYRYIAWR